MAWAPEWSADLTTDYSHPIGEDAVAYGLDVNWRSKQNTTITLDPTALIGNDALVSARVRLQLAHGTSTSGWGRKSCSTRPITSTCTFGLTAKVKVKY